MVVARAETAHVVSGHDAEIVLLGCYANAEIVKGVVVVVAVAAAAAAVAAPWRWAWVVAYAACCPPGANMLFAATSGTS